MLTDTSQVFEGRIAMFPGNCGINAGEGSLYLTPVSTKFQLYQELMFGPINLA